MMMFFDAITKRQLKIIAIGILVLIISFYISFLSVPDPINDPVAYWHEPINSPISKNADILYLIGDILMIIGIAIMIFGATQPIYIYIKNA